MGVPVLHVFSFPDHQTEHGNYTKVEPGPPLPLRDRVRKLTEEIKQENTAWTPAQIREEVRKRLRRPDKETGK
jgi:hypothetical protein